MQVTLYADPHGKEVLWTDTYTTEVKDGIFNIMLGSGKRLPDSKTLDRLLWLGVSINGNAELRPLTKLAAVPMALNVADGAVTLKKLAPEVIHLLSTQNPQTAGDWSLTGNNSLTPGTDFLGTTDASHLDMKVNSYRVMKYFDVFSSGNHEANNIVGGWSGNAIQNGGWGNVIAGGGWLDILNSNTAHPNLIGSGATSHFNFIGGGYDNQVHAAPGGAVVGGVNNSVIGSYSIIGGGKNNAIATGGGTAAEYAVVGGGESNASRNQHAFVGGGLSNTASGGISSVVGGSTNTGSGNYSAVLGGETNTAAGTNSSILGGKGLTLSGAYSVGFNAYASVPVSSSAANTMYLGNLDLLLTNSDNTEHQLIFESRIVNNPTSGDRYRTTFKAPALYKTIDYTLPDVQGSTGHVLSIASQSGSGTYGPYANTLTWVDPTATAWKLTGNTGTSTVTDGGANFIGTIDDKAFEIRINQAGSNTQGRRRILRFVPNNISANIIGGFEGSPGSFGHEGNMVVNGVAGGIVLGGGQDGAGVANNNNVVTDHFGIIVGGLRNLAGDNDGDFADAGGAVIVGGEGNSAKAAYSFIGGGFTNTIHEKAVGANEFNDHSVIAGGTENEIQTIGSGEAGWSTISGGKANVTIARGATIGGGESNGVNFGYGTVAGGKTNSANGAYAFVGGGFTNGATLAASTVAGGMNNNAAGYGAFIGGGGGERIGVGSEDFNSADASWAAIAGGRANQIEGQFGFIGGGRSNSISEGDPGDSADFSHNTISGGKENLIREGDDDVTSDVNFGFIGGGQSNDVVNDGAVITGGRNNYAQGFHSFIGGGGDTLIADPPRTDDDNTLYRNSVFGLYNVLGGGQGNVIKGDFNSVVGGWLNIIETAEDRKNDFCFIGGGQNNRIIIDPFEDEEDLPGIVIVGGLNNTAAEKGSFIGGGESNTTNEEFATITGGSTNTATYGAFIGGGERNVIQPGPKTGFSAIGGGGFNSITGQYNFIGGGGRPNNEWQDGDPLPAGLSTEGNTINGDYSTIVGGARNKINSAAEFGSIGGGWKNTINSGSNYSTIPGGYGLISGGFARTVIGSYNRSTTFALENQFQTTGQDRRIFLIGNGKPPTDPANELTAVRHNAYEVSYNGHSIVYDNLGVAWQGDEDPSNDPVVVTSTRPAVKGARYVDNTPIAWGRVNVTNAVATLTGSFGVKGGTYNALGDYTIELDYIDPQVVTPTQVQVDNGSSVVATIEIGEIYACKFINTSKIMWDPVNKKNTFDVKICQQAIEQGVLHCGAVDHHFSFVVFGRPNPQ